MNITKTIICCFLFFGITATSNAQLWKKLKKKAQDKIEQKIEEKVDKETDKVIDKTFDGKKEKTAPKIIQSTEVPKFVAGSGILKLYNHGFEYITEDIAVSVYGKFNKNNLSNAVKKYNSDKIIAPVDAFPNGYALAFNGSGYLNTKEGQITIHHADSTKVVFSLKGTWNTTDGDKTVAGSYINLNVSEIVDKRFKNNNDFVYKKKSNTSNSNTNTNPTSINNNSNTINTDITIPSTFSFNSSLEVKMTSNDGSTANLEFLLGSYDNIYAMSIASTEMGEGGKIYNVVTPKSVTMFMDVGGMKIKKTVAQDQASPVSFDDKMPANSEDLKKTGATKSILGYTCYEYKYANEKNAISVWATKNFPANHKNITMLGMGRAGVVDGFVLEIDYKADNESAKMKVVKFNKNKNVTINTSEYKSMGF